MQRSILVAALLLGGMFPRPSWAEPALFEFTNGPLPHFDYYYDPGVGFWQFDMDGPAVEIAKPVDAGSEARIRAGFESMFGLLEPDFELTVDLHLPEFPATGGELEVNSARFGIRYGASGWFHVERRRIGSQHLLRLLASSPSEGPRWTADVALPVALQGSIRLRVQVTPGLLSGGYAPIGSDAFIPLGSITTWSELDSKVEFGVSQYATSGSGRSHTPLIVQFDNVTIDGNNPAAVGDGALQSTAMALRAWPNPATGNVRLSLAGSGAELGEANGVGDVLAGDFAHRGRILDPSGRVVRSFSLARTPGADFTWDGRDEAGRRLGAGVYYAVAGESSARIVLATPRR